MQIIPESPHLDGGPEYVPIANYVTFLSGMLFVVMTLVIIFALIFNGESYSLNSVFTLMIGATITTLYHNKMRDISYRYTLAIGTVIVLLMSVTAALGSLTQYVFVVWLIMFLFGFSLFTGSLLFYIKLKKYEDF